MKNAEKNTDTWKLTIIDTSRAFSASMVNAEATVSKGAKIDIKYSGAKQGAKEYVSAVILNASDEILYYGHLAEIGETGSASGTKTLTLPSDIADGVYKLKVFSEQCNGSFETDYLSAPVDFLISIKSSGGNSSNPSNPTNPSDPKNPSNPSSSETPKDPEQVNAFVERMYQNVLKRESDAGGKGKWTNELLDGKNCGAGLAQGFICSEEFTKQGVSDEEFVDTLYHTFFDRTPDEAGKNGWLEQLKNGMSRNEVCAGFVNSQEFANLCDKFGIARGTMEPDGSYRYNEGVRNFVLRNYTETLGRAGETMGVEDWSNRINKGELSMKDVAILFLHSEEFLNKNLDDEAYIKVLYRTFMGRDYDEAGLQYWLNEIKTRGRDDIVSGFSDSLEFSNIMSQYQ